MNVNDLSLIAGDRLKTLRKERGLSHAALSDRIKEKYDVEISKESLRNYEVSESNHARSYKNTGMSLKYLLCLADFYGVSTDYLVGLSDCRGEKGRASAAQPELTADAAQKHRALSGEKNRTKWKKDKKEAGLAVFVKKELRPVILKRGRPPCRNALRVEAERSAEGRSLGAVRRAGIPAHSRKAPSFS